MKLETITAIQEARWKGSKEVALLEFGAVWCPPCKQLQPTLEQLADEYEAEVAFAQVDVDQSPELASAYGVMGMPTVLVFHHGEPVEKLVGLRSKDVYKAVMERYLVRA